MKRVQSIIRRLGLKIKVVERVGATVKGMLQRSNPFPKIPCGRDKCAICDGDGGDNCRTRGCIYEVLCKECERVYRGQTGRSVYERSKEHIEAWVRGEDDCPLRRHANLYHRGEEFGASVKVISKCYGKPSRRMITEAVMIDEIPDTRTMNSKTEWTYMKLAKVQLPMQQ